MIKVNIRQPKTHLTKYLDHVAKCETILLCKHDVPIAEIRPVPRARHATRPIGLARNPLKIPKSFFHPLPDGLLDGFEGQPSNHGSSFV